jgi:hypothetical protein
MISPAKNTYRELKGRMYSRQQSGQCCTKRCSMPFLDKMTSDGKPPRHQGRRRQERPLSPTPPGAASAPPRSAAFTTSPEKTFAAKSLRRPHLRRPRFLSARDQIKNTSLIFAAVTSLSPSPKLPGRRYSRSGRIRLPQFHKLTARRARRRKGLRSCT